MDEFAIETVNLSKKFYPAKNLYQFIFNSWRRSNPVLAVEKVNIQVKQGELFVLVGPNGAGKTTLVKMLAGLILPTEGLAIVNGLDVAQNEIEVKNSIGILTGEERSFYWRLTGRENLNFFATLCNLSGKKTKERIDELARLLGIEGLDRRFQEYSTGMKQRLAVARSLLNDPRVIFMDEPTKNLDPLAAEGLRDFIKKELAERMNKTILFCTHNMNEAQRLGSCIAIMDKAEIKALGSVEELRRAAGLPIDVSMEDIFKHYVAK